MTAEPVSRILSGILRYQDDHSSRRYVTESLQRPTRRFDAPSRHVSSLAAGLPPYLVLLHVGFTMPRSLLNGRCALTAPFHPYLKLALGAVCSLWHWPSAGLEPDVPDVIRHTALRSSDFPPSLARRRSSGPAVNQIHYKVYKGKVRSKTLARTVSARVLGWILRTSYFLLRTLVYRVTIEPG
jgi:hypothetical protein